MYMSVSAQEAFAIKVKPVKNMDCDEEELYAIKNPPCFNKILLIFYMCVCLHAQKYKF